MNETEYRLLLFDVCVYYHVVSCYCVTLSQTSYITVSKGKISSKLVLL